MNILDKHFIKKWLKSTLGTLVTFVLLFLILDIFALIADLIEHWPGILLLSYFLLLRLGYGIFILSPMAFLIGSFWMSNSIKRLKEWTVSLMGGCHPAYLLRGPLFLLTCFTVLLTCASIFLMPYISKKMDYVKDYSFKDKVPDPVVYKDINFRLVDGRSIFIEKYHPAKNTLEGITIFRRSNSRLVQRTDAQRANYNPKTGWKLQSITRREFKKTGVVRRTKAQKEIIPLVPPDLLTKVLETDPSRTDLNPIQFSFSSLGQAIAFKTRRGMNAVPEKIYWHWKLGFPLTNLVLGIFGFVVGLRTNLSRSLGIGLCLLSGFGYWIIFSLSTSLGKSAFTRGLMGPYLPLLYVYLPPLLFLGFCTMIWSRKIKL